jgi:hypothetical protein
MKIRNNESLIIGVSIPILMIVLTILSIYLPTLFAPVPKYNFIYVIGDNLYSKQYDVEKGVIVKYKVKKYARMTPKDAQLFIYDVSGNIDQEVSFEDTQQLKLDTRTKSPDGYEVTFGSNKNGKYDYNTLYLKGHGTCKRLELQSTTDNKYNYRNLRFMGWIK